MSVKNEAIIREFMAAWGDGKQELPDVDKIVAAFAEHAIWQLWVPGGPTLRGRDAIRRDIERQVTWATFMCCRPSHVSASGNVVVTERADTIVVNGETLVHHLVAVYELDDDGKITAWREYFDTKDLDRKLAATSVKIPKVAKE